MAVCSERQKYLAELRQWLEEVEHEHFDYVAAVTRRAFNLVNCLRQYYHIDSLASFVSDNALLLEAEEIAEFFIHNNRFPRTVILDDVLAHGRSLNQFMQTFKSILFASLREKGVPEQKLTHDPDNDNQKALLEQKFYESITLWVFAINDAPFFLEPSLQWRLRYQHIWPDSEWRKLSNMIAQFIVSELGANTSYVLTAFTTKQMEPTGEGRLNWLKIDSVRYRDFSQTLYLFRDTISDGVFPTVRVYQKNDCVFYTPYLFTGRLESHRVIDALNRALSFMFQHESAMANRLIGLFNHINHFFERLSVSCQLFNLVFAQMTMSVFWRDMYGGKEPVPEYDYEKIARNFGSVGEIDPILKTLARIPWDKEELTRCVDMLHSEDGKETHITSETEYVPREIISRMELSVYDQALEQEEDANSLKKNCTSGLLQYKCNEHRAFGEKPVDDFLTDLTSQMNLSLLDTPVVLTILSGLTEMMDCGDVALKARVGQDSEKTTYFYSAVRTTELSLSIMPRRISKYYKEFFRLAQLYWRDEDFPECVRINFTENVIKGTSEETDQQCIEDAVKFAKLIRTHGDIVDSMLNWRSVIDS